MVSIIRVGAEEGLELCARETCTIEDTHNTPRVSDVPKGRPVVVLTEPNDRDNVVGVYGRSLVAKNARRPIHKG